MKFKELLRPNEGLQQLFQVEPLALCQIGPQEAPELVRYPANRPALRELLYNAVEEYGLGTIQNERVLIDFNITETDQVRLLFMDGWSYTVDLVIDTSGPHSNIAPILGLTNAVEDDYIKIVGGGPFTPEAGSLPWMLNCGSMYVSTTAGTSGFFLHLYGPTAADARTASFALRIPIDQVPKDLRQGCIYARDHGSTNVPGFKTFLLHHLRAAMWGEPIMPFIEACDDMDLMVSRAVFSSPLRPGWRYERQTHGLLTGDRRLGNARLWVLGDAAHQTSQLLDRGGSVAIYEAHKASEAIITIAETAHRGNAIETQWAIEWNCAWFESVTLPQAFSSAKEATQLTTNLTNHMYTFYRDYPLAL